VGSDGKVQSQCVTNVDEAKQFLENDKPVADAKSAKKPEKTEKSNQAPVTKQQSAEWEVK